MGVKRLCYRKGKRKCGSSGEKGHLGSRIFLLPRKLPRELMALVSPPLLQVPIFLQPASVIFLNLVEGTLFFFSFSFFFIILPYVRFDLCLIAFLYPL